MKRTIRQPIKTRTRIILGIISVGIILAGYSLLSYRQHEKNPNDKTLPSLVKIAKAVKTVTTPDFFGKVWLTADLAATMERLAYGLAVGVTLSVALGVFMGCYAFVAALFYPFISFISRIPPTAMMALYFVLFGTDTQFFVAMIALGITPSLTLSIYTSVEKDVTMDLIYKGYTLGASELEVIWEVIVKQLAPRILQNVQMQIGLAMICLIAAEYSVADVGLGYRLRIQSRLINMHIVFVYLAIVGVTFGLIDIGLTRLRRKLYPWFGE